VHQLSCIPLGDREGEIKYSVSDKDRKEKRQWSEGKKRCGWRGTEKDIKSN